MDGRKLKKESAKILSYDKISKINGDHPFKKYVPGAFVDYPARIRKGGELKFFNFAFAKEIGFIPEDHPEVMNAKLEKQIIESFGIIIINEYDELHNRKFPKETIKDGKYMATRYLQLQHHDKHGRTSGDGRSVWLGQQKHKGKTWDISGNGTGATRLSPATSKYNKFFKSGDPAISYGCGYSEVEEGLATLFFSEVLHKNGLPTERILAIIEYEKNYAVNVRAHECLLRPSHFFGFLKQGDLDSLQNIMDYYIATKRGSDKSWKNVNKNKRSEYKKILEEISFDFSTRVSTFEDEYIFCWLDWDGDNILMDAGIIDYGSIRQFGLFHWEYRYDDVDRYSTNILEQKNKARYIVQSFAQIVDFLQSKKKKPISEFKNHWSVKQFDKNFNNCKNKNLLNKIGFSDDQAEVLIKHSLSEVKKFRKVFSYFERAKSNEGMQEVSDGICTDAIFCMRDILRELPQLILSRGEEISAEEFITIIASNYATDDDVAINSYRATQIRKFQKSYMNLVHKISLKTETEVDKVLLGITMRSSVINKVERVTGDSITKIVTMLAKKRKDLSINDIYKLVKDFTEFQNLDPNKNNVPMQKGRQHQTMIKDLYEIVRECREGI